MNGIARLDRERSVGHPLAGPGAARYTGSMNAERSLSFTTPTTTEPDGHIPLTPTASRSADRRDPRPRAARRNRRR